MAKFKLRRSRILHEPIKVGSLLRSSSDSGRFVTVVEIIPGDYPIVRTHYNYPEVGGKRDYDNPKVTHTTDHHDRIVVENHSVVNWGHQSFPKRKTRRSGYISPYSNESAQIETMRGSSHDLWEYNRADVATIVLSSDQVMGQGERARASAEKRVQSQMEGVARTNEYCKENGRDLMEVPNPADLLREQRNYQNPYKGNRYAPELAKLWRKGFGVIRSK